MEDEKVECLQVDYQKECEYLRTQLKETITELEKYRQALLNLCLKM